ncbi:MAG: hypothetical protein AABO41_22800 [Acidobacteriota bacterium]
MVLSSDLDGVKRVQTMLCQMSVVHHDKIRWVDTRLLIEVNPVIHHSNTLRALVGFLIRVGNKRAGPFHQDNWYSKFASFTLHLPGEGFVS